MATTYYITTQTTTEPGKYLVKLSMNILKDILYANKNIVFQLSITPQTAITTVMSILNQVSNAPQTYKVLSYLYPCMKGAFVFNISCLNNLGVVPSTVLSMFNQLGVSTVYIANTQ